MAKLFRKLLIPMLAAVFVGIPHTLMAQSVKIGVIVMHGKGGSPNSRHMTGLVSTLESQGYLVANLDMPWSGTREYDVSVSRAEGEVESALEKLRNQGAQKVFGHVPRAKPVRKSRSYG